jgi:hypothetical protein
MPDFSPLPIHSGVGEVHINRFRVVVRPTRTAGGMQEIAANLWRSFPDYLTNHNTASVERTARMYNGWPTLKFRGVARIRPFSIPIVIGGVPIAIPVPAPVRDWMMPDLHTDWVGVVAANGANGSPCKRCAAISRTRTTPRSPSAPRWWPRARGSWPGWAMIVSDRSGLNVNHGLLH